MTDQALDHPRSPDPARRRRLRRLDRRTLRRRASRPHATPSTGSSPARRPPPEQALRIWDEGMIGTEQRRVRRLALQRGAPRRGRPDARRGRGPGRAQAGHRAAARPRAVRRVRGARRDRARPPGRPAARQDADGLPPRRRRPRRRDPRADHRDQRADDRASARSSARTSATASAPSGSPPSGSTACRRTGSTSTRSTTTAWSRSPPTIPTSSRCARSVADARRASRDDRRVPQPGLPAERRRCSSELFELREQLARLVGYDTWADYDAGVKMIGKGSAIPEFIDRITEVVRRVRPSGTARSCSTGCGVDRPGRDHDRRRRLPFYEELVRRSSTTSTPRSCAPTSTSPACAPGCST